MPFNIDFPSIAFWEVFRPGYVQPIARFAIEGHAETFVHALGDRMLEVKVAQRELL